ncbi:MAG: hypothetical protein WCL00_14840 [Bacteroidota bacterium]
MNIAVKEQAQKIIDKLPDNANWKAIIYSLYVREKIEKGVEDVRNAHVIPHEEVIQRFVIK